MASKVMDFVRNILGDSDLTVYTVSDFSLKPGDLLFESGGYTYLVLSYAGLWCMVWNLSDNKVFKTQLCCHESEIILRQGKWYQSKNV